MKLRSRTLSFPRKTLFTESGQAAHDVSSKSGLSRLVSGTNQAHDERSGGATMQPAISSTFRPANTPLRSNDAGKSGKPVMQVTWSPCTSGTSSAPHLQRRSHSAHPALGRKRVRSIAFLTNIPTNETPTMSPKRVRNLQNDPLRWDTEEGGEITKRPKKDASSVPGEQSSRAANPRKSQEIASKVSDDGTGSSKVISEVNDNGNIDASPKVASSTAPSKGKMIQLDRDVVNAFKYVIRKYEERMSDNIEKVASQMQKSHTILFKQIASLQTDIKEVKDTVVGLEKVTSGSEPCAIGGLRKDSDADDVVQLVQGSDDDNELLSRHYKGWQLDVIKRFPNLHDEISMAFNNDVLSIAIAEGFFFHLSRKHAKRPCLKATAHCVEDFLFGLNLQGGVTMWAFKAGAGKGHCEFRFVVVEAGIRLARKLGATRNLVKNEGSDSANEYVYSWMQPSFLSREVLINCRKHEETLAANAPRMPRDVEEKKKMLLVLRVYRLVKEFLRKGRDRIRGVAFEHCLYLIADFGSLEHRDGLDNSKTLSFLADGEVSVDKVPSAIQGTSEDDRLSNSKMFKKLLEDTPQLVLSAEYVVEVADKMYRNGSLRAGSWKVRTIKRHVMLIEVALAMVMSFARVRDKDALFSCSTDAFRNLVRVALLLRSFFAVYIAEQTEADIDRRSEGQDDREEKDKSSRFNPEKGEISKNRGGNGQRKPFTVKELLPGPAEYRFKLTNAIRITEKTFHRLDRSSERTSSKRKATTLTADISESDSDCDSLASK